LSQSATIAQDRFAAVEGNFEAPIKKNPWGAVAVAGLIGPLIVALALRRFGIPADVAFLIVAQLLLVAGSIALISGLKGLKPSALVPSKSISQISSLMGGLQDGADFR
jgi:hypothetical protein